MQLSSDISVSVDITAKRRDTFDAAFEVVDSSGNPFTFSTHTAKMEVRETLASDGGAVLVTLNSPSELILTAGLVTMTKDKASMDIAPGEYFYDLQITYPDTKLKTWAYGAFIVTDDVTT